MQVDIVLKLDEWRTLKGLEDRLRYLAAATVKAARVELPAGAQLSLLLADDGFVRRLNRQYRATDRPTNVLSFAAGPQAQNDTEHLLGDVVLAYQTIRREADDQNKSPFNHACHLMVHGLLHLLGYDHDTKHSALAMERLETGILVGAGIPDPYLQDIDNRANGAL
jgi:probable rRNA maturation factor